MSANHIAKSLCTGICFAGMIAIMITSCVDSTLQTARVQEMATNQHLYSRPLAFRLASPTQEEMDHLHALLKLMEVNKEKK